ncbi:hypothetical protein K440DRAFT_97438 [Wilcoxina mikolae CBS 423.85]|nr:hypothetical protein K440DRAFT_97438 [Wilcoxina mikolae CBS 423.85]
MESSDNRRQGDVLPSINYGGFEREAREGAQFHQRYPSIARASISSASPISPTTMFGPSGPIQNYPQPSNGIQTPPDSRRTSDDAPGRQSLPSLHEALLFEKPGSFSAAPQTPPIGPGSFSAPHPRNNSLPNSMPSSMPRSQPSDPGLHSHPSSQPQTPHGYNPAPPPSHPAQAPPPPSHTLNHESSYTRRDSQNNGRSLQSNPYSQTQPPPAIPAMHPPPETTTYAPPPPPPPPPPPSAPNHSPPYQSHAQYHPFTQSSSPHYPPSSASSSFTNGSVQQPPPPPPSQYPPSYRQPQPPQHHQQQTQPPPPPPQQQQPPYQPHHQPTFQYPQQREGGYQSDPPGPPGPPKGVKRPSGSGYGSAIERALSISAIRRDMESIKEHSARIYHIVDQYQIMSAGGQQPYPGGLHASLQEFAEALNRSCRTTEALNNCHAVFQELSSKELAEQNAHKMSVGHASEYGTDDGQSYQDDNRSNGSQQPEKKMRRGRAAPPGRCHSCHRAETPEWRRGPDGARTLCNACGLHYAKLTRKLSKNPAGPGALAARKPPNSPLP